MNTKRIGVALAAAVVLSAGVWGLVALSNGGGSTPGVSSNDASMMGGSSAPAWMLGGSLPSSMMGGTHDPGRVMGAALANVGGPRVSPAKAALMETRMPVGAVIDRVTDRVTFTTSDVALTAVEDPMRRSASTGWSTRQWSYRGVPESPFRW